MFEHPGADRMRQNKPAVFYGGSGPPTPALVGLVRALLQEGTTLEREEPKSKISKLLKAPRVLLQGWDKGQIQAGTCCWISPGLRL